MASKIQIANMALIGLGQSTITSLTDNTDSSKKVNSVYDLVADDVMSMGAWPSTITRAALAQDSTTPAFEYDYQYTLPVDPLCLQVISVNESVPGEIDYKIEGNKLLTNEITADIKYIARITNTELYDTWLRQAIVIWLKVVLKKAFTGSDSKAADEKAIAYKEIMRLLAASSMGSGSNDSIPSSGYINTRYEE